MSLGSTNQICADEFVEAMRARLNTEDPPMGANVEQPGVRKNFEALGEAVFQILTARAETISEPADDTGFWDWITAVAGHLGALRAWQSGVRQAVQNWAPADLPGQQVRTAILAVPLPGSAPLPTPGSLTGRLR